MEDNLLFANNRKEFIQEFLAAMEGMDCNFQIDTASSGLEAAQLLKKKRYKVVVTGMHLSTFGGAKLIAYLNQHFPQTICMVYTRRMEPAYLKLLVNELRVFRIFQKPADYEKLYAAIQEGLALYENEAAALQQRRQLAQDIRRVSHKIAELEGVSRERPQEKEDFLCFMQGLLRVFQADINVDLTEGEKKALLRYEGEALQWMVEEKGREAGSVSQIPQSLAKEFHHPGQGQEMEIQAEGLPEQIAPELGMSLRFILWIVMRLFAMLSPAYQAKACITCRADGHFQVEIQGIFPEGVWEQKSREDVGQAIANVTHKILANMAERFSHSFQEGRAAYSIEVAPGNL